MHKEKPKNESTSRRAFRRGVLTGIFTVVIALVAAGVFFLSTLAPDIPPVFVEETLIVPFNKADVTWTKYSYRCPAFIMIEGTGQAAGNDFSDAFYLYTQNGQLLNPPITHHFDLEIDGNRAIITLGLEENPPPYNPEHVYTVSYDVSAGSSGKYPRQIGFRISDLNVGDNAGQFLITVSNKSSMGCD